MDAKTAVTTTETASPGSRPAHGSIGVAPEALDQVEQLWGSVFFSAEHTAPRSVIVSGAEPNEGATETAVALAVVGASANHGHRVALVDFNFRQPNIARIMGVPEGPGTLEALQTGEMPDGVRVVLAQGRLTVIPAGRATGSATAPLDPAAVNKLIQHLLAHHDHVIIDAPAVNHHSTVQALAGLTDGVILVARQAVTRREAVAEAKKRIELARGKLIGLVLNMRKFPVPGFLYRRM